MKDFSIPNITRVKSIAVWGTLATVAFPAIYGLCNFYASKQTSHYPMYLDFELSIPLVPWMIYFYMSLNLLFVLAAFVLKDPRSIKGFCLSLVGTLFIASVVFVLFPGKLGFVRAEYVEGYQDIFTSLHAIDKPFNLFPSLHVTYSTLAAMAMIEQSKSRVFHFILKTWIVLIAMSVVLVHQHHLFDIVTGLILAMIGYHYIYRRYVPYDDSSLKKLIKEL